MVTVLENKQGRVPVKNLIPGLILAIGLLLTALTLCAQDEEKIEVREYDHVYLKDVPEPMKGIIVRKTETEIYIRLRDYPGQDTVFKRSDVVDIKPRTSPQQAFNAKRGRIAVSDSEACYELARWSLQYAELREKTKEALRDSIKINPKLLDPYFLLSDLLQEDYRKLESPSEKELNDEIELYRHAINSGIDDPRIFYRMGLVVRKSSLPEAALPYFKKAIENGKSSSVPEVVTWSRHETGELLINMGKPDKALEQFETILEISPDDFRALLGKGRAKLVMGDLDSAGAALVQAVPADPYYPDTYMLLGSIAYLKGELSDAEIWLGKAQAVGLPDAEVLTTLGLVHARMGKFNAASTELAQAITVQPGYWQAELARGYLADNEAKTDDALSAYSRALQIESISGITRFKLAGAYYKAGQIEPAVEELFNSLTNKYRAAEVFKFLGHIEYERENYSVASRYLRYAISADSGDADAYYLLGMSCIRQKLNKLAERYFQKAVDLNPAHIEAINALGYLAYKPGDLKKASEWFEKARAIDGADTYASEGQSMISQILRWERWEDSFKRPDSDDISNGWKEENDARYGIEIDIDSNTARFSGIQREANKKVFLYREERGDSFVRLEAQINGLQAGGARFGVRIEKRDSKGKVQGAVVFMRDVDGSLSYNFTEERGKWKSTDLPIPIGQFPVDDKSHRFGIGFIDYKEGKLELMLDGRKMTEVSCPPLARAGNVIVGVYGQADDKVSWTLILQTVRIFRYKPEEKKGPGGF